MHNQHKYNAGQRLPRPAFALLLILLMATTAHCFYCLGVLYGRRSDRT